MAFWFTILFITAASTILIWYFGYGVICRDKNLKQSLSLPFVSIVIAAKNEYDNLKKNLEEVLLQDYARFEVIVVDDHSTDKSLFLLSELSLKFPNLKYSSLNDTQGGKKDAVAFGINIASGSWIGLTDADCAPGSRSWISSSIASCSAGDVLLGYGAYTKTLSAINKLIRFDTWYIAIQYMSFTKKGIYYMGVGRNMFYKKTLFYKAKGFSSHQTLVSGDDDLFISDIADHSQIIPLLSKETFTYSCAKSSLYSFFRQKKRHISTSSRYAFRIQILLSFIYISQLLFFVSFFVTIFVCPGTASLIYAIRIILILPVINCLLKKFDEPDLFWVYPVLELVLVIFYGILSITLFSKPKSWI